MSDPWIEVDEVNISDQSNSYSDEIDSDTEAELYSLVHHQESLMAENKVNIDTKKPKGNNPEQDKNGCNVLLECISDSDHDSATVSLCVQDSKRKDLSEQASFMKHENNAGNSSKNSCDLKEQEIVDLDSGDSDNIIICSDPECSSNLKEHEIVDLDSGDSVIICSDPECSSNLKEHEIIDLDSGDSVIICSDPECSSNLKEHEIIDLDSSDSDSIIICSNPECSSNLKEHEIVDLDSSDSDSIIICSDPECSSKNAEISIIDISDATTINPDSSSIGSVSLQLKENDHQNNHSVPITEVDKQHKDLRCVNNEDLGRPKKQSVHHHKKPKRYFNYHRKGHRSRRHYPSRTFVRRSNPMQKRTVYCYTCGMPDHFASQCNFSRTNCCLQTWPAVLSYKNQKALVKRRLNNMSVNEFSDDVNVINFQINAVRNINSQLNMSRINGDLTRPKLECAHENNPEDQKLNISQAFTSDGKNSEEKYNVCEIKSEPAVNNSRKERTEENSENFPKTDQTEVLAIKVEKEDKSLGANDISEVKSIKTETIPVTEIQIINDLSQTAVLNSRSLTSNQLSRKRKKCTQSQQKGNNREIQIIQVINNSNGANHLTKNESTQHFKVNLAETPLPNLEHFTSKKPRRKEDVKVYLAKKRNM